MTEKSRFQKELERLASKQIIAIILIGCLFFSIAIFVNSAIEQRIRRKEYLDAVSKTFYEIHRSVATFLEDEGNQDAFLQMLKGEMGDSQLQYRISQFNLEAPVGIHMIVTDSECRAIYSTYSGEELNLHRLEFNRLAAINARAQGRGLYSTVYYLAGDTSEYTLFLPLYEDGVYVGCAAAYLKSGDWGRHFLKYQYDVIVTDVDGDIIYCSNTSLLRSHIANKYRPGEGAGYQWINDSRYMTSRRFLEGEGIYLYSFIYSPPNYSTMFIGILIILGLGGLWVFLFMRLFHMMAAKTSQSVGMLVEEIRIIRKQGPGHVIAIETGDEIEEIAGQINKMVASIHELNEKNMELLSINNEMEIQNLQAQIKPHFIYNTLDNIRFLIEQDARKANELIWRFTHILRYSIDNARQRTSLQQDMEYLEDYLVIQKTRFGERFRYEVDIDPACDRILIPKLVLQPLIENSLKYGFQKKTSICVKIRGKREGAYLVMQVEDDGPGLPEGELEELRRSLQAGERAANHIGLRNINRRMMLENGHDSGLLLQSREGEGFIVTLRLWTGDT